MDLRCPCCGVQQLDHKLPYMAEEMKRRVFDKWPGFNLVATSGYRCRKHNAEIPGAAKFSLHMAGMAIDFLVPQSKQAAFAALARQVGFNGVGFYRWGCHVDLGKVREWKVT